MATATSSGSRGKGKAKAVIAHQYMQKKIQTCISFKILTSQAEAGESDEKFRETDMQDCFFGRNGKVDEVAECLTGSGEYGPLWEEIGGRFFLTNILSGGQLFERGVAFTPESLRRKTKSGGGEVLGSTLRNAAGRVLLEAKKMLAYYKHYMDSKDKPPSGDNNKDGALKHVLSKYSNGDAAEDAEEEEGEEGEDESPVGAFFIFFLFGPCADTCNQSSLLIISKKRDSKDSRENQRGGRAKIEAIERDHDPSRGVALGASVFQAAALATDEDKNSVSAMQTEIGALQVELKSTHDRVRSYQAIIDSAFISEAQKAPIVMKLMEALEKAEKLEGDVGTVQKKISERKSNPIFARFQESFLARPGVQEAGAASSSSQSQVAVAVSTPLRTAPSSTRSHAELQKRQETPV
jgi:hypothetical protein